MYDWVPESSTPSKNDIGPKMLELLKAKCNAAEKVSSAAQLIRARGGQLIVLTLWLGFDF
jgi:hypothetical protein